MGILGLQILSVTLIVITTVVLIAYAGERAENGGLRDEIKRLRERVDAYTSAGGGWHQITRREGKIYFDGVERHPHTKISDL